MQVPKPKLVNSILNIIGINSLRLGRHQLLILPDWFSSCKVDPSGGVLGAFKVFILWPGEEVETWGLFSSDKDCSEYWGGGGVISASKSLAGGRTSGGHVSIGRFSHSERI